MEKRTIRDLSQMNGRVYIYLEDEEIGKQFMKEAEAEGFMFKDGAKPTEKVSEQIMAVNRDITLNYVGSNGRIAFGSGVDTFGGEAFIRVDYRKYMNGEEDFSYRRK